MAEPIVQVPVSLIERMRFAYSNHRDDERPNFVREMLALLPQPTPTAEPCTCPPPATHLGEGPDQDCPKHGDRVRPAAPPSIANMSQGTIFRGKFIRGGELRNFERTSGSFPIRTLSSRTGYWMEDIDPSTIRDVREPS